MNGSCEQNSEGEEPPDRLSATKNRISLKEPDMQSGSFFVGQRAFLTVETVSDIEKCHDLWQKFSPKENLFETWEFRYAFYKGYGFAPYFLLLKQDGKEQGLLPLWHDRDKKKYTWFGSDWQEEVRFFVRDKNYIPLLLKLAPSPLYLNAILKEDLGQLAEECKFENDCPKYVLNINGFKSHEDFLMALKKNRRHDLRKDKRRIERQNPEIIIDNFSDIEELIALAKNRFKEKGEKTDWEEDPRRIKVFKEVIKQDKKSYKVRMITIKINGRPAGVDLNCLYRGTYYAVKCGYDVKNFSGIGNYMNLVEIDDAIKLGMKKIDFLQNNYEWKDRWFEAVPLVKYQYENKKI